MITATLSGAGALAVRLDSVVALVLLVLAFAAMAMAHREWRPPS